jgi:hypothetical protein
MNLSVSSKAWKDPFRFSQIDLSCRQSAPSQALFHKANKISGLRKSLISLDSFFSEGMKRLGLLYH